MCHITTSHYTRSDANSWTGATFWRTHRSFYFLPTNLATFEVFFYYFEDKHAFEEKNNILVAKRHVKMINVAVCCWLSLASMYQNAYWLHLKYDFDQFFFFNAFFAPKIVQRSLNTRSLIIKLSIQIEFYSNSFIVATWNLNEIERCYNRIINHFINEFVYIDKFNNNNLPRRTTEKQHINRICGKYEIFHFMNK